MTLQGGPQLMARFRALEKAPEMMMKDIVIHGVREAKLLVPRKTGNLGRSIRPGRATRTTASIMAGGTRNAGYASFVERGTRAHAIRPKTPGGVLAWGGARRLSGSLRSGSSPTRFARYVNHPGTAAQPYLVPGLQKAAHEQGLKAVAKLWNDAA